MVKNQHLPSRRFYVHKTYDFPAFIEQFLDIGSSDIYQPIYQLKHLKIPLYFKQIYVVEIYVKCFTFGSSIAVLPAVTPSNTNVIG